MNQRELARHIWRIPFCRFNMTRCAAKGQQDRVDGFKAELERRKLQLKVAGKDDLLAKLLKVKLDAYKPSAELAAIQKKYLG